MSARSPRRGRGDSRTTPSPLPSHTQQIMDAFLVNNKTNTTKYEQRRQQEAQSLILSRLKRPVRPASSIARPPSVHPHEEEVKPLVQKQSRPMQPLVQRQPHTDPAMQRQSHTSRSMQMQPNAANNYAEQRHRQEVQSPILSKLKRPASSIARTLPTHHQEEEQPLVQRQLPQPSPESNKNISNNTHRNVVANEQMTMNRRITNGQREAAQTSTHHQLNSQFDDEEEDIVCCDGVGGGFQEGTKNLCTIALWALIMFAILNRFFVHMSMYLHKSESVDSKEVGAIPTSIGDVDQSVVGMQP